MPVVLLVVVVLSKPSATWSTPRRSEGGVRAGGGGHENVRVTPLTVESMPAFPGCSPF